LPLARLRIVAGLIALAYFASWSGHLGRLFALDGLLPPQAATELLQLRSQDKSHFHRSPLFQIDTSTGLMSFQLLGVAAALLLLFGIYSRFACAATFVLLLTFVHRAPMLTGPLETVLAFLLLYLMLGPCGAAWSIDAWRAAKAGRGTTAPSWTANLSLRLIQVHEAGLIWLVACSMLGSRYWWDGTAIWALEAQTLSRPIDLSWLRSMPKLVNAWTHLFVVTNLLFPILVWKPLLRPLVVGAGAVAWLLMLPLTGQVLYIAAMITAMCAFLGTEEEAT
jgi:hypothetical protein